MKDLPMVAKATAFGIRAKLSAAFTVVSLVIAGFVIGAINMQLASIERAALLEAEHFANAVAFVGSGIALNNPEYLQSYVDGLHALQSRDLVFVDARKKGIADANRQELGAIFDGDPANEVGRTIRDGRIRTFVELNELHPRGIRQIVVPLRERQVNSPSTIIGAVIVEYGGIYDDLFAAEEAGLYLLVAAGIAGVLLSLALGLQIAARMAARLKDLEGAAAVIAEGNYGAKVSIASRDEIGMLGAAFNTMASALETKRDELREHSRGLEERVASRTRDLSLANTRLRLEADERAKATGALTESEDGLRRAQAMARLAHVITGPDGSFESWADSLPMLTGIDAGQMPKSTREWLDRLHPDDRSIFREKAIEAGIKGTRTEVEYRLRRPDGAWISIRQAMELLHGGIERGKGRWFNTLQDVTAQKQAQDALRASESLKRAILESSLDCLITIDREGMIVEFNPAAEATFGISRKQAIGAFMPDLIIPPRLREAHRRGFAHYLATGGGPILGKRVELVALRADGAEFPIELSITPIGSGPTLMFAGSLRDISERNKSDEDLRRFRAAVDISGDAVLLVDRASMRYVDVNQTFCELVGYAREEVLGMTPMDLFSADRETLERDYDAIIADNNSSASKAEGQYRHKGGVLIPIETRRRALRTKEGWVIVATSRNITERKEAEMKIGHLNRVYAVLSGINAAIVRIRDRDELFREACRIAVDAGGFKVAWLGIVNRKSERVEPVAWHGVDEAYIRLMPLGIGESTNRKFSFAWQAIKDRKPVVSDDMAADPRILLNEEARLRGFHALAMLPLFISGDVVGVLALYAAEIGFFDREEMKLLLELAGDISFALEHIEKSERADYLAYYDELTGLANRRLFLERLNQFAHSAGIAGEKTGLVLLDVERIRAINESLGRQAGDALLKQLAGRLAAAAGSGGLARIGADVFALVLQAVKGKSEVTRGIEKTWRGCFGEPFRLGESDIRISAKAGAALYPNDGIDAETLIKNAEAALRKAKKTGEQCVFYALEMTARTSEKLTLENSLRQALEKEEFVLHYQPKVDSETRHVVGVEALIRWQSPELGLVPPMKFIPLMEETGLILPVGSWALKRASLDHKNWVDRGLKAPRVAVNVSPIQLRQRNFVSIVEQAILEGVAPTGIDLEITESLIMEDIQGNIEKLKLARGLGVSIAIDDFGTGYSSLGYLAKLPVQTLKIDRSFVITMLTDTGAMTLVQTMITLAHALKLKVVAEGVDEEEQAKFLRLIRCDEMQGYLFSRPIPFDQMTALLTQQAKG